MRRISIAYCGTCNYRPIAASLARVLEAETGIKPELIHSPDKGAFEVTVNEERFFQSAKRVDSLILRKLLPPRQGKSEAVHDIICRFRSSGTSFGVGRPIHLLAFGKAQLHTTAETGYSEKGK
jgi:selT/selW/selH-like putative selenoprotein